MKKWNFDIIWTQPLIQFCIFSSSDANYPRLLILGGGLRNVCYLQASWEEKFRVFLSADANESFDRKLRSSPSSALSKE